MRKKRIAIIIMALCLCLFLCGAGLFNTTKVLIDTENNCVYDYCTADEIIAAFTANSKAAKEKYQGQPVYISGRVVSVGDEGKNIMLTGSATSTLTIECSCDKSLRTAAMQYKGGDRIALYGRIIVSLLNGNVYLKVDKITGVPDSATSLDMYYLLDGTPFDKRNATKVTLNNGGVEYYIPSTWANKEIQRSIQDEKLGAMEGYQYVLNNLNPSDTTPESLFVCYFDNKTHLAYTDDADETTLIEKAIVENILGSVGIFPSKKVTTYYGSEYAYYLGVYKSIWEAGKGYRAEFVFQPDGEDGIVVILYLYRDAKHLSDIMFLTRFLEVR